jgi:tRNA U34 5-carboxymethylaminomethyl modifying GTPase MnmE/TrmE
MLLMEAMNNASSLLTRVTDFSDEEKEERLREVNAKRQELSDEIQARLDGIAQPTWLKKNLVWVIVGSVVIALFLLYAFFKYIGRRN